MQRNIDFELRVIDDHIFLDVGGDRWRILLSGVRRIKPDWFVHVVALGPRVCAFTIRVDSPPPSEAVARMILTAISNWLRSGDPRRHVFLELTSTNDLADLEDGHRHRTAYC